MGRGVLARKSYEVMEKKSKGGKISITPLKHFSIVLLMLNQVFKRFFSMFQKFFIKSKIMIFLILKDLLEHRGLRSPGMVIFT